MAASSEMFMKIFKEAAIIPVKINVDDFDGDTVKSALCFIYSKEDAIKGKEMQVYKFGRKFDIKDLIDACCSFFEKSVDPSNVCDYVQLAYENNLESLKQNCLNILVEKKKEIDATEKAKLPKIILLDAYCL